MLASVYGQLNGPNDDIFFNSIKGLPEIDGVLAIGLYGEGWDEDNYVYVLMRTSQALDAVRALMDLAGFWKYCGEVCAHCCDFETFRIGESNEGRIILDFEYNNAEGRLNIYKWKIM